MGAASAGTTATRPLQRGRDLPFAVKVETICGLQQQEYNVVRFSVRIDTSYTNVSSLVQDLPIMGSPNTRR